MTPAQSSSTRVRLVAESMRLFGRQGYAGTTVSEIEAAAGLSGGSGSLYRHFPSKEALLSAGIREQIAQGAELLNRVEEAGATAGAPLRASLTAIAVAGLRRLEQEQDFNRILIKDLSLFPELLEIARTEEIARIHAAIAAWLRAHAASSGTESKDWAAMATVIIGSISHFWLLRDIFGTHPADVDEERYITALVDMVVAGLAGTEGETDVSPPEPDPNSIATKE
jgi:AcrR family transcriptional regulator